MTVPMPRPALALAALALAVAAIGLPAGLAGAQDLSEAQLTALFQDQIEHIRAATAEPGLGASRGLTLTKIAPAGGDAGQDGGPVSIEAATVAAGNGTKKVLDLGQPASQTASAAPGEAPLLYLALPKDEQVRFQVTFAFDSAAIAPDQAPRLRVVCDAARGPMSSSSGSSAIPTPRGTRPIIRSCRRCGPRRSSGSSSRIAGSIRPSCRRWAWASSSRSTRRTPRPGSTAGSSSRP